MSEILLPPDPRPDLLFEGRPFTRADADDVGVRLRDIAGLVTGGVLRQPLRGVYVDARAPDDLAARASAVGLLLPPGALVCRFTAAWLLGLDCRGPEHLATPLPVECAVPVGRQPIRRDGVRCYETPLSTEDACVVAGLPCTTAVRTAIDLLRWSRPHVGLAAADTLCHHGLVLPDEIVGGLERFAGAPGIRQARYLAGLVEPLTESPPESWTRLRLVDAGFPRPTVQIVVRDVTGHPVYRLDMGWEDERVAVEYDGEEHHSSPTAVAKDLRRRTELEGCYCWRMLVVGRGEVLGRQMLLEQAAGELLSLEPKIRRRQW